MMGNPDNNPYKIAQVAQIAHNRRPSYNRDNSYFVEIGSNVDFAFICICAHAINNLVSIDEKRERDNNRGGSGRAGFFPFRTSPSPF